MSSCVEELCPSKELEGLGECKRHKGLIKKRTWHFPNGHSAVASYPSRLPRTIADVFSDGCTHAISSPHRQNERFLFILCFICSTPATQLSFLTLSSLSPSVPMVPTSPGFHLFLLFPAKTAVFPRALYLKEG